MIRWMDEGEVVEGGREARRGVSVLTASADRPDGRQVLSLSAGSPAWLSGVGFQVSGLLIADGRK